jgi:tetratricopeptide (TPR) repeat protein
MSNCESFFFQWRGIKQSSRVPRRLILQLFTAAVMALLIPISASAAENFETLIQKANDNYRLGSYEEALKLYKKANRKKKNDFDCLWHMALSLNQLGQYGDSLNVIKNMIKISGSSAAQQAIAVNLRGNTLFDAAKEDPKGLNKKMLREAENSYREALKISPNLNLAHYNLGVALIRMDRMDEGLGELRTYLRNGEEPDIVEQAKMILQTPKIPVPEIELMQSVKIDSAEGYRNNYVVKIKNWESYTADLFKASKSLPPCTLGASPAATGTRLEITVMGDIPPSFPPMCNIRDPRTLQALTVFSQMIYRRAASSIPKQKYLYVRIKDRLTGNMVFSQQVSVR